VARIPQESSGLNPTANSAGNFPAFEYQDQERQFVRALQILEHGIAQEAFPACSLAVTHCGKLVALKGFGQFTFQPDSPDVDSNTIFDLASLTKVLATTAAAMVLYERGLLDLDLPVVSVFPEFVDNDARRQNVTVKMLLEHSSGLPAYEKLFLDAATRDKLLHRALNTPLTSDPQSEAVYSDIGFIILGVLLERVADTGLDAFCRREIFGPLGMAQTSFSPPAPWIALSAPTMDDRTFRHRVVQGEVQDENAYVMGGVAGHAGLFGSAADIAAFAHAMLRRGHPILRPETVATFTRRASTPPGSSRALGWDTPSFPSQSGQFFSPSSFGHLGYTGTSLWIDPERELSITLLTNRTWPDCTNQAIKQIRPRFHDAVIQALEPSH
jgi:CubicO group peptidase (beta-lactamase class C family)